MVVVNFIEARCIPTYAAVRIGFLLELVGTKKSTPGKTGPRGNAVKELSPRPETRRNPRDPGPGDRVESCFTHEIWAGK